MRAHARGCVCACVRARSHAHVIVFVDNGTLEPCERSAQGCNGRSATRGYRGQLMKRERFDAKNAAHARLLRRAGLCLDR